MRWTHIEDVEDPIEIRLPGGDRHCIGLRLEESRDRIPATPFHDLSLYIRNSPAIESTVNRRSRNVYWWFNSRRQLVYRIDQGLTELVQPLSVHPPVKRSANFGTG